MDFVEGSSGWLVRLVPTICGETETDDAGVS